MKKQIYHIDMIKGDKLLEYHVAADSLPAAWESANQKMIEAGADGITKIELTETVEVV